MNAPENIFLPDVQASADTRRLAIQNVGVRGLRYPLQLETAGGEVLSTVANLTMTVGQYGWRYESTGGIANPSASALTINNFGQFGTQGVSISGTTPASCQGNCENTGRCVASNSSVR